MKRHASATAVHALREPGLCFWPCATLPYSWLIQAARVTGISSKIKPFLPHPNPVWKQGQNCSEHPQGKEIRPGADLLPTLGAGGWGVAPHPAPRLIPAPSPHPSLSNSLPRGSCLPAAHEEPSVFPLWVMPAGCGTVTSALSGAEQAKGLFGALCWVWGPGPHSGTSAHAADTSSFHGADAPPQARAQRVRLPSKTTVRAVYGLEISFLQYWWTIPSSRKAAL